MVGEFSPNDLPAAVLGQVSRVEDFNSPGQLGHHRIDVTLGADRTGATADIFCAGDSLFPVLARGKC